MKKLKNQFFYVQCEAEATAAKNLKNRAGYFKTQLANLSMTDFHKVCETCLPFIEADLYTSFLQIEESLDLDSLSKKVREKKEYIYSSYRKTLINILVKRNLQEVLVWFYFLRLKD